MLRKMPFIFALLLFSMGAFSQPSVFSGRVSKINKKAKLLRLKIDFANAKYLKDQDRLEFWNESYPEKRCLAYVEARSSEYLLLKVPQYISCVNDVYLTVGSLLMLSSSDLKKSLMVGEELVDILLKKRMALQAKMLRHQRALDQHVEKMDAVNKRYEVLRQKLEIEWQKELALLEEDKTEVYMSYKHSQARLYELEHKLQKYRIEDENLTEDRWSLDPKLYFKK
tara:strand:- start:150976 stop:151650 length:675 start_codon:yes stop_codon:yes gene_type:complete